MAQVVITAGDVEDARSFMVALLAASDRFEAGAYAPGTVLHDAVIKALAFVIAYMRGEYNTIRSLTDIRQVLLLADETERLEAIDAFAANMFASRISGRYSRGPIAFHFNTPTSGWIPSNITLTGANGLAYVLDTTAPIFFSESDLVEQSGLSAPTTSWALPATAVAANPGPEGDMEAGPFANVPTFHPLLVGVEATDAFVGGENDESAEEFFERLPELLTVRNFVTPRSIRAVLDEGFPTVVRRQIIGAGDLEMVRDQPHLYLGPMRIHTGGHVDLFIHSRRMRQRSRALVSDPFTYPSERLMLFTDISYKTIGVDMRTLVRPGATLRLDGIEPDEAPLYSIRRVEEQVLFVSPAVPFRRLRPTQKHEGTTYTSVTFNGTDTLTVPRAAAQFVTKDVNAYVMVIDGATPYMLRILLIGGVGADGYGNQVQVEISPVNAAALSLTGLSVTVWDGAQTYSVGLNNPAYDDLIRPRPYGQVTDQAQIRGAVALSEQPVYRVHEVNIDDPTSENIDAFTGLVRIPTRANVLPDISESSLEYVVEVLDPIRAQSTRTTAVVHVGASDGRRGTHGVFVPAGVPADEATLKDDLDLFTAQDVGRAILLEQPSNLENAVLFEIIALEAAGKVRLRRVSTAPIPGALQTEVGVHWRFDATYLYHQSAAYVDYETLVNHAVVRDAFETSDDTVIATYPLTRGFHPVVLSLTVRYQLKDDAQEELDETAAAYILVEFIRTFSHTTDTLNVDDFTTHLRDQFPQVGNVLRSAPTLRASYTLLAPSGSVVAFESTDVITMDEEHAVSIDDAARWLEARDHGASDRTAMLISDADLIAFEQVT